MTGPQPPSPYLPPPPGAPSAGQEPPGWRDPYAVTPPGGPGPAAPPAASASPHPTDPYAAPSGPPPGHAPAPYPWGGYGYTGGYHPPQQATNGLALASLITSLVGLVTAWFVPVVVSIVGVVLGHVALSQIRRTGQAGRGMAIAGLVLGYVVIAGSVLLLGLLALGLMAMTVA